MSETIQVWKFTKRNGLPTHGIKALPKPKNGKPGAWHYTGGPPILCNRGVHGCRTLKDAVVGNWINKECWVAELLAPFEENIGNKIAGRAGRLLYRVDTWNDQTARLFAADCAEAVGHLHPIVASTILVARRFALGLATDKELNAAETEAMAAAWSSFSACYASWYAAMAAAAAASWYAAWATLWSASWYAAWTTAGDAAGDAVRDSLRSAQAIRLHAYLAGAVDIDAIRKSVED
jgi:hypothetical protein